MNFYDLETKIVFLLSLIAQDYHKENGGQLSLVVSVGCGQYPAVPLGDTSIHAGIFNTVENMLKLKNIQRLFVTAVSHHIYSSSFSFYSLCMVNDSSAMAAS